MIFRGSQVTGAMAEKTRHDLGRRGELGFKRCGEDIPRREISSEKDERDLEHPAVYIYIQPGYFAPHDKI